MSKGKDKQSNKYQLTINNPKEKGYSHDKIKQILITNFPTIKYFCMADEQGNKEETFHTHIFICFSSRVRFSTVKKHFETAHIESTKGTVSQNIEYIKKEGKWENDIKHETRMEGTFEEWGDRPPDSAGKRHDMTELYDMIRNRMSNVEIMTENQDYILLLDKIDKVRTTLLTEEYKEKIKENMKIIYIYGATGTGKTRGVLKKEGAKNVYRVTDYQHPFDGYSCQPVLVFDEFRSGIRISDMLNYCDIYPIELPARFSNKFACYERVYIISNWSLEQQYESVQKESPESWKAFLRRINEVHVYHSDFTIDKYSTIEDYLHRNKVKETVTTFQTITKEDQLDLPF